MVAASVSLGMLILAGAAVGGFVLVKKSQNAPAPSTVATPAPAPSGNTLPVGNGVVVPVGSSNAGWSAQQALEAERAREEAWRRADKISGLERDLATAHNEIKRLTDQLNVIDGQPVDPTFLASVADREWATCRNSGAWLTQAARCNNGNMEPRIRAAVTSEWGARTEAQKRPLLTRLSELNSQQLSLIANLRDLGVIKQPVAVRTT